MRKKKKKNVLPQLKTVKKINKIAVVTVVIRKRER